MKQRSIFNRSGRGLYQTKQSICEPDENRHRRRLKRGRRKKPHHEERKHSVMTPNQRKINYSSLFPPGGRTSSSIFSVVSFLSHNLLVHLIGVSGSARQRGGGAGGRKRWKRKEHGEKWKRQTQTDRARQRQSISVPWPKKRCLVGRLWVPRHDKEQKQEGCRPDQVGAAWQMERCDYSLLGRETSVW